MPKGLFLSARPTAYTGNEVWLQYLVDVYYTGEDEFRARVGRPRGGHRVALGHCYEVLQSSHDEAG